MRNYCDVPHIQQAMETCQRGTPRNQDGKVSWLCDDWLAIANQMALIKIVSSGRTGHVFEATYKKGYVAHAALEPHAAIAQIRAGGDCGWGFLVALGISCQEVIIPPGFGTGTPNPGVRKLRLCDCPLPTRTRYAVLSVVDYLIRLNLFDAAVIGRATHGQSNIYGDGGA